MPELQVVQHRPGRGDDQDQGDVGVQCKTGCPTITQPCVECRACAGLCKRATGIHQMFDGTVRQNQSPWVDLLWLLGLALLLIATGIGLRDPWPADEPRFALVARDMVATGDWLLPRVGGQPYADKPPLFFWLIATGLVLTHSLRVAFLLPSFLAGFGCVALVYDLGGACGIARPDSRARWHCCSRCNSCGRRGRRRSMRRCVSGRRSACTGCCATCCGARHGAGTRSAGPRRDSA